MPIAGKVHIDATVEPSAVKAVFIHADTLAEAEQAMECYLETSPIPDSSNRDNHIVSALDTLALALADHGHVWTSAERSLYDRAISLLERDVPPSNQVSSAPNDTQKQP